MVLLKAVEAEPEAPVAAVALSDFIATSRSRMIRLPEAGDAAKGPEKGLMNLDVEATGQARGGRSGLISLKDLSSVLEKGASKAPEVAAEPSKEAPQEAERAQQRKVKRPRRPVALQIDPAEEGDPLTGPLVFGVGDVGRGVRHVVGVFGLVFVGSLMLSSVLGLGARELALATDEAMIFARAGLLSVAGIAAVAGLRREGLERLGWVPRWKPFVLSLLAAVAMGSAASALARFEVDATATLAGIFGLLTVRAFAEVLFFQGFVTRTLLVEMKNPASAVLVSAGLYGLYALTYVPILQASPAAMIYAVLVYTLGGGLPLALMYARTRSVAALFACQFIILLMAALGGLSYATKLAG